MATGIDKGLIEGFVEEAQSSIPNIFNALESYRNDNNDVESLRSAHRNVHTIKGAASMIGLTVLSQLTYFLEEILQDILDGETELDSFAHTRIGKMIDQIERYFQGLVGDGLNEAAVVEEVVKTYRRLKNLPEEGDSEVVDELMGQGAGDSTEAEIDNAETYAGEGSGGVGEVEVDEDIASHRMPNEIFHAGANEQVIALIRLLHELENIPISKVFLQESQKRITTIYEVSVEAEFFPVVYLSGLMQDLVNLVYYGEVVLNPEIIDLLLDTSKTVERLALEETSEDIQEQIAKDFGGRFDSVINQLGTGWKGEVSVFGVEQEKKQEKIEEETVGTTSESVSGQTVDVSQPEDKAESLAEDAELEPVEEESVDLFSSSVSPTDEAQITVDSEPAPTPDEPTTATPPQGEVETDLDIELEEIEEAQIIDHSTPQMQEEELILTGDEDLIEADASEPLVTEPRESQKEVVQNTFSETEITFDIESKPPDTEPTPKQDKPVQDEPEPTAPERSGYVPPTLIIDEQIDIPEELLEVFLIEADEHLENVARHLSVLEDNPELKPSLQEVRRSVHTIKGAAGMVGFQSVSQLAHRMEDLLDLLYDDKMVLTPEMLTLLYETSDALSDMIGGKTEELKAQIEEIYWKYYDYLADSPAEDEPQGSPFDQEEEYEKALRKQQRETDAITQRSAEETTLSDEMESMQIQEGGLDACNEIPEELLEVFLLEVEEHFGFISQCLEVLRDNYNDKEKLEGLRRSVHTIKGAAGMVGLAEMSTLSGLMENYLDIVVDNGLPVDLRGIELFTISYECFRGILSSELTGDVLSLTMVDFQVQYQSLTDMLPEIEDRISETGEPEEILYADEVEDEAEITEEIIEGEHIEDAEEKPLSPIIPEYVEFEMSEAEASDELIVGESVDEAETAVETEDGAGIVVDQPPTEADEPIGASSTDVADIKIDLETIPSLAFNKEDKITAALPRQTEDGKKADKPKAPRMPKKSSEALRVPLDRVDELVNLVSELIVSRSTFEQQLKRLVQDVDELKPNVDRLRDLSHKMETQYEVLALGGGRLESIESESTEARFSVKEEFDELEMDRYTEFHLMSREMTETSSDFHTIENGLVDVIGDFDSYLTKLGRLTSEVQDKLMHLRMVPLDSLSTRLQRTVRVTAAQKGKQVGLVIVGEDVELDKTVLEEMADPFLHILRNSIDHGIESAEDRIAMGKPEKGAIELSAYYEGTNVVIKVQDDGKGIDLDAIRQTAVSKGFITDVDVYNLSEQEVYSLIFLPGFSTAREISEVSGRGVGMDVVKSTVNRLKGSIVIDSTPSIGTTFTIRLPMTLAITRVMMVKANSEVFAIPLLSVFQLFKIAIEDLESIGNVLILREGDNIYPILRLGELLNLPKPAENLEEKMSVLLMNLGESRIALVVDQILEAREVVVKTLGQHLKGVRGVTGATIMGDGRVVLILNPVDLVMGTAGGEMIVEDTVHIPTVPQIKAESSNGEDKLDFIEEIEPLPSEAKIEKPVEIMIVDDSLSVRRVMSRMIKNTGWTSVEAKDGLEALESLQRQEAQPDVVLLDIEMPRMDGYELLSALRAQQRFKDLPIIMITSRAGEKHRKKAFELGATEYIVKPYQEDELIEMIRRFTKRSGNTKVQ